MDGYILSVTDDELELLIDGLLALYERKLGTWKGTEAAKLRGRLREMRTMDDVNQCETDA